MTQTTAYFGKSCGFVEYSLLGTTFTDIGGTIDKVEVSEQTIKSGEVYTQEGATAIITSGKQEPIEINFTGVYSDIATEGYTVIKAAIACNGDVYLRWGPSTTVGDPLFSSGAAKIVGFQEPGLDAEDPVAMAWGFKIKCASVTTGTVPAQG